MKLIHSLAFLLACSAVACGGESKPAESAASAAATADIVETAKGAGQFKTLLTAVHEAGLEDTLRGPGPYTVFAPTDAAFAKLPAGTVDSLLKPENKEKLKGILTYHVVAGRVGASEASQMKAAKTVSGKDVTLTPEGSGLKVNRAQVVKADIPATNGVIHVVDSVLMPE